MGHFCPPGFGSSSSNQYGSGSETLLRTLTVETHLVGKNVDLEELLQICDAEDGFLLPAVDVTNHGIKA